MRLEMRSFLRIGLALAVACVLAACGTDEATLVIESPTEATTIEEPLPEEGRIIKGTEALELYGVGNTPTPAPPPATPQIWFPAKAWVEPSILPYDPDETINFLPMFSNMTLDEDGLWLGDLESGQEVVLHGVSSDGRVCLVEGPVLQGWSTKGWVACNRLRFTESE
jgi:hypothetical protein